MAHGVLIMQNCTIRYIMKYETSPGSWHGGTALESYDGGIVELYACTFLDNFLDVHLHDYLKENEDPNLPNQFSTLSTVILKRKPIM